MKTKVCVHCGNEFQTNRNAQKLCGEEECGREYKALKWRVWKDGLPQWRVDRMRKYWRDYYAHLPPEKLEERKLRGLKAMRDYRRRKGAEPRRLGRKSRWTQQKLLIAAREEARQKGCKRSEVLLQWGAPLALVARWRWKEALEALEAVQ